MKRNHTFLVIILGISLLSSGCIFTEEDDIAVVYEFNIILSEVTNVTIMLPIPVLNGKIIDFGYSSINIEKGDAELSIIESVYGPCLEVKINNSNELSFSSKKMISADDEFYKSVLSMSENIPDSSAEYYSWVCYDGIGNATLELKYHREGKEYGHIIGPSPKYSELHIFENGWNKAIVDNRIPLV